MRFSNVQSVEIIRAPASLVIRYTLKDGQIMGLEFPGVVEVEMTDLRPWKGDDGRKAE